MNKNNNTFVKDLPSWLTVDTILIASLLPTLPPTTVTMACSILIFEFIFENDVGRSSMKENRGPDILKPVLEGARQPNRKVC